MAKFAIVKATAAKLLEGVAKFQKLQQEFHDNAHVLAVSVLFHAAEHGDVRPLNNFFNVLAKNYQTALKLYWMRIQKENPEVNFLTYTTKEGFKVKTGVEDEKKTFMAFAQDNLINPDGEKFKRFYERDILVEVLLLDNAKFATQLASLLKKARGEAENVNSTVDKKLIKEGEIFLAHVQQAAGVEAKPN